MKLLRMYRETTTDGDEDIAIAWNAREVVGLIAALIQAQVSNLEAARSHDWQALEMQLHAALAEWRRERQAECQSDRS